MDAIKKRKLSFNIQLAVTVIVFFILYKYAKKELGLPYLIIGILLYIGAAYFRFSIIKKNFYIQKVKKNKYLEIINKLLPLLAFVSILYIPNKYALNVVIAVLIFNMSMIINERYTRYILIKDYNKKLEEYNKKNKGKK
ncbi:hypothetical protein [Miniphocaeibacter massiliensis]|uniref:hypothetical protein n=1 Tax=Miniphocaeibacter massiliensis TaxID=2041841 RepID=UPI000C1BE1D0|nr:hypothetical protein [Miniphocaeibacter massiliensis]